MKDLFCRSSMSITECLPEPDFSEDTHYLNEYEFFDDGGEDESSNCAKLLLPDELPSRYSTPCPSPKDFKFDDIQAEGNDPTSRAKLSDDTEFAQLDIQQGFQKAIQNGDFRLVQN